MFCSVCGSRVAAGRTACDTCGARVSQRPEHAAAGGGYGPVSAPALPGEAVHVCPRCGYRGPGMSYFSRGLHVAALVTLTILTGFMMGLGGLGYFLLRHNDRICPRCNAGWGRHGAGAAQALPASTGRALTEPAPPSGFGEGARRGWAVFLLMMAVLFTFSGLVGGEIVVVVMGLMAGGGAYLAHQGARSAREARREALINSMQLPVLKLAAEKKGVLTVTQVAAELGWTLPRAEKVLNSLDDGLRVTSDVTDDGVIVYQFRELMHAPSAPPGRGALPPEPPREGPRAQLN